MEPIRLCKRFPSVGQLRDNAAEGQTMSVEANFEAMLRRADFFKQLQSGSSLPLVLVAK